MTDRKEIAGIISNRLNSEKASLRLAFGQTSEGIGHFIVDNILPVNVANACFSNFANANEMKLLDTIRERKYVSAQMDRHNPILEEVLFGFQEEEVVECIGDICNIQSLYPDPSLYAGGLSLMAKDHYLKPHLDNSHDAERNRWRVLNLLYYVTPNWEKDHGGNLELWPSGVDGRPIEITSKFNRLVVMATHQNSWHSVNQIAGSEPRCCISNYYFSDHPIRKEDQFHVTTFTGRPEDGFSKLLLNADSRIRQLARRFFSKGIRTNPHIYRKNESENS